jgi:hypothetical protein
LDDCAKGFTAFELLKYSRGVRIRYLVGLCLVISAAIAFYLVASNSPKSAEMWAARHNLLPGQFVTSADLEIRKVRFETHSHSYLSAEQPIVGMLLTRAVMGKELIPTTAISEDDEVVDSALIVLPVGREFISSVLDAGEKIDIYSVSNEAPFQAKIIGKDLGVLAFDRKGIDFNNLVNLTLIVPIEEVEQLLSNTQGGNFRIVQHQVG